MKDRELDALTRDVGVVGEKADRAADAAESALEATQQLADALGIVADRMRNQGRSLTVNSLGAYALFTFVLGGAFLGLYNLRSGALVDELADTRRELAETEARASEAEAALELRHGSSRAAFEHYRLLQQGRHLAALSGYEEIMARDLSETERALFADAVADSRKALLVEGLDEAKRALAAGEAGRAETALRLAMAHGADGDMSAQARFHLGLALLRQGRDQEAVTELEAALAAGAGDIAETKTARFHLAAALERLDQKSRAHAEYDRFARRHPKHPLAWKAKYRVGVLGRKLD